MVAKTSYDEKTANLQALNNALVDYCGGKEKYLHVSEDTWVAAYKKIEKDYRCKMVFTDLTNYNLEIINVRFLNPVLKTAFYLKYYL